MPNDLVLRGTNLRYALTMYVHIHGQATIGTLLDGLEFWGFLVAGRPSKALSDALRWEVKRDRVRRLGRGLYGPGQMPRSTEYRIHHRVIELRESART